MDVTVQHGQDPAQASAESSRCRVRVWFGEQVLCQYSAPRPQAERYAAAMRRRFLGLRVTVEAVVKDSSGEAPLPTNAALWPLTVK